MELEEALRDGADKAEALQKQSDAIAKLKEVRSETADHLSSDVLLDMLLQNFSRRLETLEVQVGEARIVIGQLQSAFDTDHKIGAHYGKDRDKRLDAIEETLKGEGRPGWVERMFPKGFSPMNVSLGLVLCLVSLIGILEWFGVDVVKTILPFLK